MFKFSKSLQIRNSLVSLILLSLIFAIVSCGENPTNKAKEFMSANMYEQAIALLEQEIQKSPKNATAHLLLGECKLVTGRFPEAQESFKSATVLQPDLGMKIGEVAISAANSALRDQKNNQAFQIMSLAHKYDPKTSNKLSAICIEKAKELIANNSISESMSFFNYALSQNPSSNIEISNILLNYISNKSKDTNGYAPSEIIDFCVRLDPAKSKDIGEIYFNIGTSNIESTGKHNSEAIINGYSLAAKYDKSFSSKSADKLFAYSKSAYIDGDLNTFFNAYKAATVIDKSITTKDDDTYKCLNALFLYYNDMRSQALSKLKLLNNSDNDFVKNVSKKILSPPAKGLYPINLSTEIDRNKLITLIKAEVIDANTIRLYFSLKNLNKTDDRYYLYETDDKRDNMFRIIDSNGKEFLAKQKTLVGGNHGRNSFYGEHILLKPSEEALVHIDFPMLSEGAHGFTFKSGGSYSGWQNSYWFKYEFPM